MEDQAGVLTSDTVGAPALLHGMAGGGDGERIDVGGSGG